MNYIQEILKKHEQSIDELINCIDMVRKNGEVAIIKFDGERTENMYTVFISFPGYTNKEMIRSDKGNLKEALLSVLKEYVA